MGNNRLSCEQTWNRIMAAIQLIMNGEIERSSDIITRWLYGGYGRRQRFLRPWYYASTGPMIVAVAFRRTMNKVLDRPLDDALPEEVAIGIGVPDGVKTGHRAMMQMAAAYVNEDPSAAVDILSAYYKEHGIDGVIDIGDAALFQVVRIFRDKVDVSIDMTDMSQVDWTIPDA